MERLAPTLTIFPNIPSRIYIDHIPVTGHLPLFLPGREIQKNDPAVTVDYNTGDPVVRWDSYENFNERFQDSLEGERTLCNGSDYYGVWFSCC